MAIDAEPQGGYAKTGSDIVIVNISLAINSFNDKFSPSDATIQILRAEK
jgi:hypothetical protein